MWFAMVSIDVRFFVTALGNPKEATELIHQAGGIVYHNVTHETWAKKALESGVDGLICVNERAGGHAGTLCSHQLYQALSPLGVPLIAAGGIGDEKAFHKRLQQGYAGVQMGTRFIATHECNAHPSHKQAIIEATASDIVFTDKLSSIPCSVIKNPLTQHLEEPTGPIQGRSNKYLKK